MKRMWVVLALLGACSSPLRNAAFLEGSFPIPDALQFPEVPADAMRYLLWFPPSYESGDPLPLVVFLHGSGDDDYDSRWLTSHGLPGVLLFDGAPTDMPFVLLAPQAAPGTAWMSGRQPETVMALIDSVVAEHGLDGGRISLTGLSMGGYGTWHLATRFPGRFTAVASVSGTGFGTTGLPEGLDVCGLASVDLRGYHGADDMISLLDHDLQAVDAWQEECGGTIDFRIIQDSGHFATFEQVYRDPAFYEWLLTG